jgi:hypothetical protein
MLVLGISMLTLAVIAVLLLRPIFNAAVPPRWTTFDLVGELVAVLITALVGFGVISTGVGVLRIMAGQASSLQVLLALAIPIAAGALMRLRQRPVGSPKVPA